jgi:hypothetical protein
MKYTLAICLLLSSAGAVAWAAPSRVDRARFQEILADAAATLTESLDYDRHGGDNPYRIANGTLLSVAPARRGTLPTIEFSPCPGAGEPSASNVLGVEDPGATSTFSEFPPGTTLWGAELCFLNPYDILEVTVVGGSGTATITTEGGAPMTFLGFTDSTGLMSVTIRNLGAEGMPPRSYYYDEITTASAR